MTATNTDPDLLTSERVGRGWLTARAATRPRPDRGDGTASRLGSHPAAGPVAIGLAGSVIHSDQEPA